MSWPVTSALSNFSRLSTVSTVPQGEACILATSLIFAQFLENSPFTQCHARQLEQSRLKWTLCGFLYEIGHSTWYQFEATPSLLDLCSWKMALTSHISKLMTHLTLLITSLSNSKSIDDCLQPNSVHWIWSMHLSELLPWNGHTWWWLIHSAASFQSFNYSVG